MLANTFVAGVTPSYPGTPAFPTAYSAQVKERMKELDGLDIPDLDPTLGGATRKEHPAASLDLVRGINLNNSPSTYTPKVLDFLDKHDLHATFFVVGSHVVSNPRFPPASPKRLPHHVTCVAYLGLGHVAPVIVCAICNVPHAVQQSLQQTAYFQTAKICVNVSGCDRTKEVQDLAER
ncbi:uncharacterized protein BXZ73DRAFT_111849 [Epithele typhae]|uniref:uncharacterized protein n=1 Tax=Epithele typhae TaxID=378194 RepID=UPI0020077F25|nr:uncharacterized protein BXZ73DRAFT_111849 [Epithele typhae]KAH9896142.1 hypothetical protein BXZ73DRAFT_111849 [Epithele typhae]